MKGLNILGYVFTAAVLMGQAISTASSQSTESLSGNFIEFDSAPDKLVDGSVVRVRYQCSRRCQLAVEVAVSTLRGTDLVVFRRKWISSAGTVHRFHQVQLRVPHFNSHRQSSLNKHVVEAQNATVSAWLDHLHDGSEHGSIVRIYKVLQIMPPTECPSWSAHLMWQMTRNRLHQCPLESDVIDMLKFPLASTGERFGMVRRFQPFIDAALERSRLQAVTQPSVTISVWIYLLKWCHEELCGIIHHVDSKNLYSTVLMHLTDTGDVIIQARVTTGEDEAFRASVGLPLWKWIRLDCYIQDAKCLISFWNSGTMLKDGPFPAGELRAIAVWLDTTWDDVYNRYVYDFAESVYYDDTDGYFVIGGSKFMPGFHGYFGPIKYYRFGIEEVNNQLYPKSTLQDLDKTHHECQNIKAFTAAFLQEVIESHLPSPPNAGFCNPYFIRMWNRFGEKMCKQTWTWEAQLKYSALFHFLQKREEKLRTGLLAMKELRNALFEQSVFAVDEAEIKITSELTSLLQASSCFGNHKASLLLATIHLSGLGGSVNQNLGHVYSLIGASGDDRFSLMHAGYKHTQGIDGFPKDMDMAYSYYSNAATQSSVDSLSIYENKQYTLEHIYLSNEEDLNSLTHETSDLFRYMELKAAQGDIESQRHLGALLYWGQFGVSKDIASAVKWLKRSAMQMKDPAAMCDYSLLLIKGQGVKRNYTRGFQLLEKAAEMGSINALNGLGWYHEVILNDHESAVRYFEQAALNGSDDGMFNLGTYYLNGKHPESPWRNETAAFQHFLNASRFGHGAASVEAAWYLSTGSLEGVSQDAERAVIMLKKVCEQNGHLGFIIREALHAYLKGSWREAYVKYVLAAETGLGLAQSNVAHLCEERNLGYDCQWRYHNYSILNYAPHPSALLKMGDYYSYYSSSTREEDSLSLVGQAISMYSRAALAGSPQGMYNLAILAQQGHPPPSSVHALFNVTRLDEQGIVAEKILKRCVEIEDEEAETPCSLALLRVQMGNALRKMSQSRAQLLLAYAALLSVFLAIVTVPLQICFARRDSGLYGEAALRAGTSSVSPDGVNLNGVRGGIMGGIYRVAGNLCVCVLNGEQWLWQIGDLAVTLSGVCLCALCTALFYHLL